MYARHCEQCGRLDLRERFASAEEVEAAGVWTRTWTCQECGSTFLPPPPGHAVEPGAAFVMAEMDE